MDKKKIIIKIADKYYSLDSEHIFEIIRMGRIFKIPNAPEYISGVVYHDADLVPAFDFGAEKGEYLALFFHKGERAAVIADDIIKEYEMAERGVSDSDTSDIVDKLLELEALNG